MLPDPGSCEPNDLLIHNVKDVTFSKLISLRTSFLAHLHRYCSEFHLHIFGFWAPSLWVLILFLNNLQQHFRISQHQTRYYNLNVLLVWYRRKIFRSGVKVIADDDCIQIDYADLKTNYVIVLKEKIHSQDIRAFFVGKSIFDRRGH